MTLSERLERAKSLLNDWDNRNTAAANELKEHLQKLHEALEKPTELKQIDWGRIAGSQVPVRVGDTENPTHRPWSFLQEYHPEKMSPFRVRPDIWMYATLDTGLWVPNVDGKNPWPEGVNVEVWFDDRVEPSFAVSSADGHAWILDVSHRIKFSRFHSLQDGWRF